MNKVKCLISFIFKIKYILLFSLLFCASLAFSNQAELVPFDTVKEVKSEEGAKKDVSECIAVTTYKDKKCGDDSIPEHEWITLQPDECAIVTVHAKSRWNASNLKLEKGEYIFKTKGKQTWSDATIRSDIYGRGLVGSEVSGVYSQDKDLSKEKNVRNMSSVFVYCQRVSDQPLFRMIGVVSDYCGKEQTFGVDLGTPTTIDSGGQFCSFANDHPWFYSNNSGSVELIIKRIFEE